MHITMKRVFVLVLLVALFSVAAFATDTRFVRDDLPNKQLVGPGGIYMQLTQYNKNYSIPNIIGYEAELQVFTPEFTEKIKAVPAAFLKVFVVKDDKIAAISTTLPAEIPADGYLVVGHGRAGLIFMEQFVVGDKVTIRDYTPVYESIADYPTFIIMPDGSEVQIDGWNRGRGPDEIVVYNSDFGDRTYANEWGLEYAVDDNDEVAWLRKMADVESCEIPEGGYVISSHGATNELVQNIMEWDYIELDN